jgi:DNA phosphorothioation-dependent restriction protein DptG
MTIYGTLKSAVKRKSKYKHHWIGKIRKDRGTPKTRQGIRHDLVRGWYEHMATWRDTKAMPRVERRKLARAYAAGEWRERLAKAKEQAA